MPIPGPGHPAEVARSGAHRLLGRFVSSLTVIITLVRCSIAAGVKKIRKTNDSREAADVYTYWLTDGWTGEAYATSVRDVERAVFNKYREWPVAVSKKGSP